MQTTYSKNEPATVIAIEFSAAADSLWIESIGERLAGLATLDAAEAALRAHYPTCFVYRGGRHVALHLSRAADSPRLAMAFEAEAT